MFSLIGKFAYCLHLTAFVFLYAIGFNQTSVKYCLSISPFPKPLSNRDTPAIEQLLACSAYARDSRVCRARLQYTLLLTLYIGRRGEKQENRHDEGIIVNVTHAEAARHMDKYALHPSPPRAHTRPPEIVTRKHTRARIFYDLRAYERIARDTASTGTRKEDECVEIGSRS